MRSTIRGRWRGFTRLSGAGLTAALLLLTVGLTSGRSTSARTTKPARNLIIVNSLSSQPGSDRVDLARAIAMAAHDPRDNQIEFDPAVFTKPVTLVLNQPITVAAGSGNDSIRGLAGESPSISLNAKACPDAGIICGGNASLNLANLVIEGGRQRAILLKDKARVALENVIVHSDNGPGIALFGASKIEIKQSQIRQAQTHGIEVHGTCTADLRSVQIVGSGQSGIAGFDRAVVTADACRLDRNGHWNVVLTGQSRAKLSGCTLVGAQFANADISESTRIEMRNCTIEHGDRFGVFATGRTTLDIAGTSIRKHANRGIEMQDSAALRLTSSEIDGNGDYGLILFEQCQVKATDCKLTRNTGHGASLRGKASGDFERCAFTGNRYSGLGCLDAHDGGAVRVTQCTFQGNGMRPIYRGPLHLDPLVPTPLSIDEVAVTCQVDPGANVELYLDRAGEASRYMRTLRADDRGRFRVSRAEVPPNWVMTAAATAGGATSEFNVIAGAESTDVVGALLARTGPLSDAGGGVDLDGSLRRWRTGTRIILHLPNPPSAAVQQYTQFLAQHVGEWTRGAIRAELCTAATVPPAGDAIVVSVRYMPPDSAPLLGRGGVTYMKWDAQGYFVTPMKILLASGKEADDTCPRVLAHEFGHVLGLCHVRVGLLSRMQGSSPPTDAFINDFSPMLTFYDVLALQTLHSPRLNTPATLRQVAATGNFPPSAGTAVASIIPNSAGQTTYSPPPDQRDADRAKRTRRP